MIRCRHIQHQNQDTNNSIHTNIIQQQIDYDHAAQWMGSRMILVINSDNQERSHGTETSSKAGIGSFARLPHQLHHFCDVEKEQLVIDRDHIHIMHQVIINYKANSNSYTNNM